MNHNHLYHISLLKLMQCSNHGSLVFSRLLCEKLSSFLLINLYCYLPYTSKYPTYRRGISSFLQIYSRFIVFILFKFTVQMYSISCHEERGNFRIKINLFRQRLFFAVIRAGTTFQNITISRCHIVTTTNPIYFG